MEEGLTKKQAEVYNAIVYYIEQNGFPPTMTDLCEMVNKSIGAIQLSLKMLKRKGFISMEIYKPRTIRILK